MGITFLSRIKPVAKSSLFAHRPSALPRVFFCDLLRFLAQIGRCLLFSTH